MKRASGFTLVELLAVVAIITILAAMLLPTMERTLESSRIVSCQNNLRQLNFAFIDYLNSYHKYPTGIGTDSADTYGRWGGKCGTYWSGTNRLLNPYIGFTSTETTRSEGALLVFKCPSDNGGGKTAYTNFGNSVWDLFGTSYSYNASGNYMNETKGVYNKRPEDIPHPSRAVVCSCWSFLAWHNGNAPCSIMYWHDKSSLGWGNVLFADGHTAYKLATMNNPDYQNGEDWTFIVTK